MSASSRSELLTGLPKTLAEIVAPNGVFISDAYPSEALLLAMAAERSALIIRTLSSTAVHGLVQTEVTAGHMAATLYPRSPDNQATFVSLQLARQAAAARTIQQHIVTRSTLTSLSSEAKTQQADRLAHLGQLSNGIVTVHLINDVSDDRLFLHNVTLVVKPGMSVTKPSVYVETHNTAGGMADFFIPAGDPAADGFVSMYELAGHYGMDVTQTRQALRHI